MINDIVRYIKVKPMSRGAGHPEVVPASGSRVYPRRSGKGAADGTGDFESASRAGPARAR